MIPEGELKEFKHTVYRYYRQHGRDLPWRRAESSRTYDPYKILVSEIMLQQTQVNRVIPKYEEFLKRFPSVQGLAAASLGDVLRVWSGLGYNRRAKYLWQSARTIVALHQGKMPQTQKELVALPGIGTNTAGAILVYAFNQPTIFIETNIRTVFIHHFFPERTDVSDREVLEVLEKVLMNPKRQGYRSATREGIPYRDFYWALMDYGTFIKSSVGNASRQSSAYTKQGAFHGSRRQVRGAVLRELTAKPQRFEDLKRKIADSRLEEVLADLEREQIILSHNKSYRLA